MKNDKALRKHLLYLLQEGGAHLDFDTAVKDMPFKLQGQKPKGGEHSPWQLLEHLRICQRDILDFCVNPRYVEKKMEEYWPSSAAPPSKKAWDESVAAFRHDLAQLKGLAGNPSVDLFARISHGSGQTCLRELLLVADHNAYHVGQLVAARRALGSWKG